MKSKKVTMQMIADRLGVSKVSVYKALNNQPYVSRELKDKIIQVADELGYRKNKKGKADLSHLAFIVPVRFFLEDEHFYRNIFYYINNLAHQNNIHLVLFIVSLNDETEVNLPEPLTASVFDGLFLAGEIKDKYIEEIAKLKIPTLFIDFYKPNMQFDCVISDNFLNGFNATNYLIERGHKRIGFLGDYTQTSSISDRYFGYQKALVTRNLDINTDWHLVNNNTETGVYTLNIEIPDPLPDAFVCHCDMAAYFLIQRLTMCGIKVPEDVSIISFDNTLLSESCTPALTSVNISTREIAEKSFQLIVERINNPHMPTQRIYTASTIIERDSVRNIKNRKKSS